MAIKEISSTDAISVDAIKILIYGQPGLGKTTLALTAKNPLVLDFDLGAHRAGNRTSGKVIRIDSWLDVNELMREANRYLKPHDTIIIDTVGRCLDYLTAQIIQDNPKSGNRNGALTMSGWGELKGAFGAWIKQLVILGKDVIMIAHDKEKEENDVRILRPDVPGGSYAEVLKQADFVGYMYKGAKDLSLLNFNPTERTIGKNSAKFPILEVPDVAVQPQYFAGKITEMKEKLSGMSVKDMDIRRLVNVAKSSIANYTDVEQFNSALAKLNKLEEPILSQVKKALWVKAQELNIAFNQATKQFEAPDTFEDDAPLSFEEPKPIPPKSTMNVDRLIKDAGANKKNGAVIIDFE